MGSHPSLNVAVSRSKMVLSRLLIRSLVFVMTAMVGTPALAHENTYQRDNANSSSTSRPSRHHHRVVHRHSSRRRCPCGVAAEKLDIKDDQSKIVRVEVSVDERGRIISASAISGRKDLHQRAEAEARAMKFEPAVVNGRAVGRITIVVFDYSDSDTNP